MTRRCSKEMFPPQIIAFIIAAIILALGGLVSNGFIATVMIFEWAKCQRLPSSEQLLLSLGMSNIFTTVSLTGYFTVSFFFSTIRNLLFQILLSCIVFFTLCRYIFTAWLCVFYCVKIVNSTHYFFLWWKLRISWLLPRLIVGSLIFSLLSSMAAFYFLSGQLIKYKAPKVTNVTQEDTVTPWTVGISFFVTLTGCPLVLVLLCSILVIASLCRHVCQMAGNESYLRDLQTEAHIKAAGTVVSLLCLYVSFYVAHILIVTQDFRGNVYILAAVTMMVYSPAQAAILIFVNPKLKRAALWLLPQTK